MRAHARAVACVAIFVAVGCHPWYRLDEIAGRESDDIEHVDELLAKAREASASGDADEAASLALDAVRTRPQLDAIAYFALAGYLEAAGRTQEARAVARWKLDHLNASDSGSAELRAWLAASLARDGLVADAREHVEPIDVTPGVSVASPPVAPPPSSGGGDEENVIAMTARCASAPSLTLGTTSGTLEPSVATARTSCGARGPGGDVVYRVVLAAPADVQILEQSQFDAVLELRTGCATRAGASVLQCTDDAQDRQHSAISVHLDAGTYYLVVDSFTVGTGGPFTLTFSQGMSAPPAAPAPGSSSLTPSAAPLSGEAVLAPGFQPDPHAVPVRFGGPVHATTAGSECRGWVTGAPTFRVSLSAPMSLLRIYAVAEADTTLVVNDAAGTWLCADDTFGINPSIDIANAGPGSYDVWVGAYGETAAGEATLYVTELATSHP